MNAWAVIVRELREQARRPSGYWARFGAVGLLVLLCGWLDFQLSFGLQRFGGPAIPAQMASGREGRSLFAFLELVLFGGVWILGPLTTADALSRERREGTLGLLFLTPLGPWDVVVAKWITHALRMFVVLMAALPVMLVPVLLGGVGWMDGVRVVLLNAGAAMMALAAGLVASSMCRERVRASLLAVGLGLLSAAAFAFTHFAFRALSLRGSAGSVLPEWSQIVGRLVELHLERWRVFVRLLAGLGHPSLFWGQLGLNTDRTAVVQAAALLLVAVVFTVVALWIAAESVRRSWRKAGLSSRQAWFLHWFCTPLALWRTRFQRRMRLSLERNPVGWLQHHSWSARLTGWGWAGLIIVAEGVAIVGFDLLFFLDQLTFMLGCLMASVGFASGASFRRERQTGFLELLLVTPLSASQIVFGRLRGIWRQFIPALLVVVLTHVYFSSLLGGPYRIMSTRDLGSIFPDLAGKLALVPLAGMYFGLRMRNLLAAWFLTLAVGLVVPSLLGGWMTWTYRWLTGEASLMLRQTGWVVAPPTPVITVGFLVQLFLAMLFGRALLVRLRRRDFALSSG